MRRIFHRLGFKKPGGKTVGVLIISVAVVATAFFFRKDAMEQAVSIGLVDATDVRQHHPKAYTTKTSTVQFGENGNIAYELMASRIEYIDNFNPPLSPSLREDSGIAPFLPSLLANQDIARLDNPTVNMRGEQGLYQIVANRGYVVNDRNKMEFIGDVLMSKSGESESEEASSAVYAATDYLRLDIERSVAETDATIAITGNGLNFKANAFRADMERGTLRFYEGVEGAISVKR